MMRVNNIETFPQQTGIYAVKVKNGAGWRDYDTARLQISVGMPGHEGEKFNATIEWVKHRFDKVIICVNDTLQRFNSLYEQPDLSEYAAFETSKANGDAWIARNKHTFESLKNLTVYRWEDWKASAAYSDDIRIIKDLYETNQGFRGAVEENVQIYWERKYKGKPVLSHFYEKFVSCSTQYILEETAIFASMYEKEKAADIYPGTLLVPAKFFQENDIPGAPAGFKDSHHTRIDFKRLSDMLLEG